MAHRLESVSAQNDQSARREAQRRLFHRNQAIGLLVFAAAILAWRIAHTPSGWLFPPGWWRLW